MCRAPSISFFSSPCLRPVEADPPIPTARTPRQAQAVEGTRQGHTATRAGWGLNQRWTKTGRRAASPSTVPWTPPGPGPESSPTLRNVWTAARKHLRSCPGRDSDAHAPWTLR